MLGVSPVNPQVVWRNGIKILATSRSSACESSSGLVEWYQNPSHARCFACESSSGVAERHQNPGPVQDGTKTLAIPARPQWPHLTTRVTLRPPWPHLTTRVTFTATMASFDHKGHITALMASARPPRPHLTTRVTLRPPWPHLTTKVTYGLMALTTKLLGPRLTTTVSSRSSWPRVASMALSRPPRPRPASMASFDPNGLVLAIMASYGLYGLSPATRALFDHNGLISVIMASSGLYGLIPASTATSGLNGLVSLTHTPLSHGPRGLVWSQRPYHDLYGHIMVSTVSIRPIRPHFGLRDLTWPPRPQYGLNGLTLVFVTSSGLYGHTSISVTSLRSARPRLDLAGPTGLHGLLTVSATSSLAFPASPRHCWPNHVKYCVCYNAFSLSNLRLIGLSHPIGLPSCPNSLLKWFRMYPFATRLIGLSHPIGLPSCPNSLLKRFRISGTVGFIVVAILQIPAIFLGAALIDKFGRRTLLMASAIGECLGCLLTGLSYLLQDHNWWKEVSPILALIGVLVEKAISSLHMTSTTTFVNYKRIDNLIRLVSL
uniref:Major facilitator superfamily (MFS) profile domain-containing protein n=1 Tax=Fagus sylvatica TaxID=28930 RepID=A0A2N9IRB3_FAGSY